MPEFMWITTCILLLSGMAVIAVDSICMIIWLREFKPVYRVGPWILYGLAFCLTILNLAALVTWMILVEKMRLIK